MGLANRSEASATARTTSTDSRDGATMDRCKGIQPCICWLKPRKLKMWTNALWVEGLSKRTTLSQFMFSDMQNSEKFPPTPHDREYDCK